MPQPKGFWEKIERLLAQHGTWALMVALLITFGIYLSTDWLKDKEEAEPQKAEQLGKQ
jgi:predicted transporter